MSLERFDVVLAGNYLTTLIGAAGLAEAGRKVCVVNPTPSRGGHFTRPMVGGPTFDPGAVSHEFTTFNGFRGDAPARLEEYLKLHPETIVALAHFDMDLYEPTKKSLELLRPYLTRGSVLAFDELVSFVSPGETVALREVFGLDRIRVRRSPAYSGHGSYVVVE
jgi:hypothetical protein